MKIKTKHIIFLVIIISLFVFLIFKKNKKPEYKWYKTYGYTKKEPYDFGVFVDLISQHYSKNYKPLKTEIEKTLNNIDSINNNTYFFIGSFSHYNESEQKSILNFVAKGNNAFIVSEYLPDTFIQLANDFEGKEISLNVFYEDQVTAKFEYINSYSYNYKVKRKESFFSSSFDWRYIEYNNDLLYYNEYKKDRFCALGKVNDKINFIKIKHKNGFIYYHSNPIMFTNYFLLNDTGFNYVNQIFSKEFSNTTLYHDYFSLNQKENSEKFYPNEHTPLSFILDNQSLKWAWYILLFLIVLFFMFKIKRTQRVIPVLKRKENSSISYAETISNLYYVHSNHNQILKNKHQHWLHFIRTNLNIQTNEITSKTIELISQKSGVSIDSIKTIFHYYEKYLHQIYSDINNDTFIQINSGYESFYKQYNTKKINN